MQTTTLRDTLARRINERLFYGWVVLAVAALGLFASGPGQSHIFSVFIAPISEDLGISRTAIASAYALATLVAALGLPYVGRLIDRFGARRVVLVVALLFGIAQVAFGQVTNLLATLLLKATAPCGVRAGRARALIRQAPERVGLASN
jgi:MFS family permease